MKNIKKNFRLRVHANNSKFAICSSKINAKIHVGNHKTLTSLDDPPLFGVCNQQHMAVQIKHAPAVNQREQNNFITWIHRNT